MTIVANTFTYVVGADTHAKTHTLAVLDAHTGAKIDTRVFPTSSSGAVSGGRVDRTQDKRIG